MMTAELRVLPPAANYELAYIVEHISQDGDAGPKIVVVIIAGTRENFYEELKRYWK